MSHTTSCIFNKKTKAIAAMIDEIIRHPKKIEKVTLTKQQYRDWMSTIPAEIRDNMQGNPFYRGIELTK